MAATSTKPENVWKKWLLRGGVAVLVLCLTIGAAIALVLFKARQLRERFTAAAPIEIPLETVPRSQARRLARKYAEIKQGLQSGKGVTVALSDREINQMIARAPELEALRKRVHVTITGDRLSATVSMPLPDIAGLRGRYLNGDVEFDIQCRNGIIEIHPKKVTVRGRELPARFMKRLRRENLARDLYKKPQNAKRVKYIESVRVENGKLVLTTGK